MFRKIYALTISIALIVSVMAAVFPRLKTADISAAQTLELSKYSISLGKGEIIKLDANQEVLWRTSDRNVVSVDRNGNINAVSCGTANVYAKTAGGEEKYCRITVKNAPQSVSFPTSRIIAGVGERIKVSSLIPAGSASSKRVFSSSDTNILRMTKTEWQGEFLTKKAGAARVQVRLYNGRIANCLVIVRPAPKSIRITRGLVELGVGEKFSFGSAIDSREACYNRTYRTSNSSVVKMTRTNWQGDIVAMKPGTAYVTVRTYNGKESSCKVIVGKAPSWVRISKGILTLDEGESYTLSSSVNAGATAYRRTYRTSNSSILKLTSAEKGSFTALRPGKAYITVRTYNGKESGCCVNVRSKDRVEVRNGVTYINGVLIVNKSYSLPENYGGGLDPTAYEAFRTMASDAADEGIYMYILSGYRSYYTQQSLYNSYCSSYGKAEADRFSARPGFSEHQTGLAMDINDASANFTGTAAQKWLARNCWKYGFVIRYPEGKEHITGYMYESWHVRYLGKELAKTLYEKDLTLEEYFGISSKYDE